LAKAMPRAFSEASRQLVLQAAERRGGGGNGGFAEGGGLGGATPGDAMSTSSEWDSLTPTQPKGDEAAGGSGNGGGQGVRQGGSAPGSVGSAELVGNPLATSRGGNWAIDVPQGNPTSWNRPLSVTLAADQILIAADEAGRQPQVISFAGGEVAALDALSTAVKQRVKSWGLPPTGGYWKPTLSVHVAPGAETRFQRLQLLLHQSGLQLERK
jgi:hypothetical protein